MNAYFGVVAALLLSVSVGWSSSSRTLNLVQLSESAGFVVAGKVREVRRATDSGTRLPVKFIILEVTEPLKGNISSPFTFKQLDDQSAAYVEGEEVLLFLYPMSKLGLTSPVGAGQGNFRIKINNGTRYLSNFLNNRGLLQDVGSANIQIDQATPQVETRPGPIREDRLLNLTRQAVQATAPVGRSK